jgi:hypothetical protein
MSKLTDKDWYEIWEKFAWDSDIKIPEQFQTEMTKKHGAGHYFIDEDTTWNMQKDLIQELVNAKLKELET